MAFLPQVVRDQIIATRSQYITKEGDLLVQSQRNRTQEANKEDCFQKLAMVIRDMIAADLEGETARETKRRVSRLMKYDNENRLKTKKIHSSKKAARQSRSVRE